MHRRDDELVRDLVDDIPGQHGVCCEEEKVAVRKELGCLVVCHVAHDRRHGHGIVRPVRDPPRNVDLVAGKPLPEHSETWRHAIFVEPCHRIMPCSLGQPGQVHRIDSVRVNDDQMAHPEPREHLDEQHPAPPRHR